MHSVVAHHTPGDGSIYVRDDYLVVPIPEVNGALASTRSLVLSGYTKHGVIRTVLQLQRQLQV